MKKIFLFLGAALMSLAVSATEYDVLINSFNVDLSGDNNIEITKQLNGAIPKTGDVINLTIRGYCEAPAIFSINAIADQGAETNDKPYWCMISAWMGSEIGTAEVGTEFNVTKSIPITADGLTAEKYIVQMSFSFEDMLDEAIYQQFKFRPTAAALSGDYKTHQVTVPTFKFGSDGGNNYKAEVAFETETAMATDDVLEVTFNGKFSETVVGIIFMVFDNDGHEVLPWSVKGTFQAGKDVTVNQTLELVMPNDCPTTAAKLAIFIEGYDAEKPIKFLKDGDVEHDPVEVAKKEYTEVTLEYNQYATPANYQFIESEVASDVQVGDYVTFSINGVSSAAFSKMKVYLRNPEGYSAISEYVEILANTEANGTVSYSGKVEASAAAAKCDLVFEIPDEAAEGTSIVIAPEGATVHEAVELAEKTFKSLSLAANVWDGGSNYQYVEEITAPEEGFLKGDYVSFSVSGVASHDITKLQVVLINDSYEGVSEYVTIAENIKEGDEINFTKKLALTGATDVCKLSVTTTDEAIEGVETITFTAKDNVAVDDVTSSAFAVEGGMVYSAGEIVVYNVAGKQVASASKSFNVNSLSAGVYFITAKEGTIKFVK